MRPLYTFIYLYRHLFETPPSGRKNKLALP